MVSSISTSNLTALQKAADNSASYSATSSTDSSSSSDTSTGALSSIANNENNFLKLLTTQLQHQDPSSPMDSKDMAAQIAQFASVEQQAQTNVNLKNMISLQESSQLTQSSSLVGKTATFSNASLPLQSGKASINYSAGSGQTIGISVSNSAGTIVKHDFIQASGGSSSWTWDGKDDSGNQLSDGSYSVAVKTVDNNGNTSDIPFTSSGKITGIQKGTSGVNVMMGSSSIPFSSVQSTT